MQNHAAIDRERGARKGCGIALEKIEDMKAIIGYGVMSTPGVVVDGQVVHSGGVPTREKIASWL